MIFTRLISIALRKYAEEPPSRRPAVRMLLRNAVRLGVLHLGAEETAAIARETLAEKASRAA